MTNIDEITRTWALAAASPDVTARVFYSNLFTIAPQTEVLFQEDMDAQGQKLMETIGFVVDNLEDVDSWKQEAEELAIRHVAYGVKAEDYDAVGAALLQTFQSLLGPDFGPPAHAAWATVYTDLAGIMKAAAYT